MKKIFQQTVVHSIAGIIFILLALPCSSQSSLLNLQPKSEYFMCSGVISTTDISGTLFDSGGSSGNYNNSQNCSFLIIPGCAFSITLSFNSFHLESCCDYFKVYDGTDNTGDLLLSASGSTLPNPVTALSGAMYITFTSDGSVVYSGWEAVWTSIIPITPPIAEFSVSNNTPLFNTEVQFTDLTTNLPGSWHWSFGDGQTSILQNPVHDYLQSGLRTVTLISDNCFSTDTVSHDLFVLDPPDISIAPNLINSAISTCGDSVTIPLTINNSGTGPLSFSIQSGSGGKKTVELLALTYGVDYNEEYVNTLEAINQYFTDYNLTEINTTSASILQNALIGKDLLLIPEQEEGLSSVFTGFSSVLQSFVSNGGFVIFCGTMNYNCITNTGLFNITSSYATNSYLTVLDNAHPITTGLPPTLGYGNAIYVSNIQNPDAIVLVEEVSEYKYAAVSYREIGSGIAIFIAYDYYEYDDDAARIIANSVQYSATSIQDPDWFSFAPDNGLIAPGETMVINVKFNSQGLVTGVYLKELNIDSNDPFTPHLVVPCYFALTGEPTVCLPNSSLDFGEVMVGNVEKQKLPICNSGCSNLIISNMVTSSSQWLVSPTSMIIPPFEQDTASIFFIPSSITNYEDTLYIFNNDSLITVSLNGTGIGAPSISLSQDVVDITITDCDETSSFPLMLYNTGQGTLEFAITGGANLAYDSTSLQNYYINNATTNHIFSDLLINTDSLNIIVTINGDFDNSSEYAELFIDGSFIEQIEDGNPTNGTNIQKSYLFSGSQLANWMADGSIEITIQNSIEVNPGMGGSDFHQAQIISNGIDWLTINPSSGFVAVNDSILINLLFDGYGMLSGLYQSQFYIHSNDPLYQEVLVPVSMNITGAPEIELSDNCINFGNVMAYSTTVDSIYINNTGCSQLTISGISNEYPEFIPELGSLIINPYSSAVLYVAFSPNTVDSFSDTITIQNSDSTFYVCLTGTALEGPSASVDPGSLSFNLEACGDSDSEILSLANSGAMNLTYDITFSDDKSTIEMLALTYGVDYDQEYVNTLEAINQFFTDYNLTEINTTSASILQNALVGKDLLLIPEQEEGSSSVFTGFSPVLQSFVSNGGFVIFCGTLNYSCITNTGLFNITNSRDTYSYLTVLDNTHPITAGLSPTLNDVVAIYVSDIQNPDAVVLVDEVSVNHYAAVSYREIGSGKAIFIAYDYYEYDDDAARIIGQAVEFVSTEISPGWLTVEQVSGIVPPSGSDDIMITANSEGLQSGIYTIDLEIHSNDPQYPVLVVPISLEVDNNPCAAYSYSIEGCNGVVNFIDESLNNPITYLWDFGDGETSTVSDPVHTYSSSGNYVVELIVCNATDCDTVTDNVLISGTYGPVSAICYPDPYYNYSYYGISNVSFGTINNYSRGSFNGFEDFTCSGYANVIQGLSYTLSVTTLNYELVRVWIDYDNSGSFEASEMIMDAPSGYSHTQSINISQQGITNTGLRMRIGSERYDYPPLGPCVSPYYGQFEDYTIMIQSNNLPPIADLEYEIMDACTGIVQFTDISGNFPTSWFWNFGDGNVSADQNPIHIYTIAGVYSVSLSVNNAFGSNTTTSNIIVNPLYPEMEISGEYLINQPMQFSNNTIGAISWMWSFGDGYSSSLQNPVHIYTEVGDYLVVLTVTNDISCVKNVYELIYLDVDVGYHDFDNENFSIFPNPSNGKIIIYSPCISGELNVSIIDMNGAEVHKMIIVGLEGKVSEEVNLQFLNPGIYLIKIRDDNNLMVHKIIIE